MIKRIEIASFGTITGHISFDLGGVTLLAGKNGSGKSTIACAIMLGLAQANKQIPQNWERETDKDTFVSIDLLMDDESVASYRRYFQICQNPGEHYWSFSGLAWEVNRSPRPDVGTLSALFQSIYLSTNEVVYNSSGLENPEEQFLTKCARVLGVDSSNIEIIKNAIWAAIESINSSKHRIFQRLNIENGLLYFQNWRDNCLLPFACAGFTDKSLLLAEFALQAAISGGADRRAIMIFDDFASLLDGDPESKIYEQFSARCKEAANHSAQVIITGFGKNIIDVIDPDVYIKLDNGTHIHRCEIIRSYKGGARGPMAAKVLDIKKTLAIYHQANQANFNNLNNKLDAGYSDIKGEVQTVGKAVAESHESNKSNFVQVNHGLSNVTDHVREIEEENRNLKAKLVEQLQKIGTMVEPKYFLWIITILANGSVSSAAKKLGIPNSTLHEKINKYAKQGSAYKYLYDMIKIRQKGLGKTTMVILNESLKAHNPTASQDDIRSFFKDMLDALESANANNWQSIRDELIRNAHDLVCD